jgi:hypothetical protein
VRNAFARVVSRAVAASVLFAGSAQSQASVQLAFSGPPVSFASPTVADYAAAMLETTAPLPFQISTTSEPTGSFTTTVYIRSASATLGGGKSVADMEWRRGDESSWRALTTTDAIVESHVAASAMERARVTAGYRYSTISLLPASRDCVGGTQIRYLADGSTARRSCHHCLQRRSHNVSGPPWWCRRVVHCVCFL